MAKELTGELYLDFLKYFTNGFPRIRAKFPPQIEWSLLKSPYCTRKPLDMLQEDFDEFRRIELEWFIENGITVQHEGEAVFVNVIFGRTIIPHRSVKRIIKLTDNSYSIICETMNDELKEIEYSIVGDIDYVNRKLNIA